VPADALAAFSWSGSQATSAQLKTLLGGAGAGDAIAMLEQTLGVGLDRLLAVADGQGVAYLRPGLIIPEVTIVLQPHDPAGAARTLHEVGVKLAPLAKSPVRTVTQGGRTFEQVSVSIVSIAWGRDGDRIVITTSLTGYDGFGGTGAKLVDTERFKSAAADTGLGDRTAGVAYVDVKALAPLVNTLATAAGDSASDPTVRKLLGALGAVQSVAASTSDDGGRLHVQAVVRTVSG
jgi:hypothetical protein